MNRLSPASAERLSASSRWARRLIAIGTLTVAAVGVWAQNAVSTLAGSGSAGFANGQGTAASFRFTNPAAAVVDSTGNVFIADPLNQVIRKIDTSGNVTTFAGTAGTSGNGDGTGTAAFFSSPQGLAIDGANNIYVADTGNHAIRMVTSAGVVTTLAGTAGGTNGSVTVAPGFTSATGTAARFSSPIGVACDSPGGGAATNVFVADTQNNAIRQIVVSTKAVTTLAGSLTGALGYSDNTNNNALFSHPDGIVSDAAGATLYVADTFNHRIRKIVITAGPTATVSTLAGSGTATYAEGTTTGASFSSPTTVAFDASGNVLVGDTGNHVIRTVTTAGVTSLLAGTPNQAGLVNGLATSSKFNVPSGVAARSTTVYVVDANNQLVRKIAPAVAPTVASGGNPANATVTAGTNATFSVTAATTSNPPVTYQWQRSTDSGNSWSSLSDGGNYAGTHTNQLTVSGTTFAMNGNQFRVVLSNGVAPDATSTVALLTVNQIPTITNSTTTFNATLGNPISGAVITATGSPTISFSASGTFPTWAQLNPSTGVISGTPTLNSDIGTSTFTVTASNTAGSSNAVTFSIVVQSGPAISAQPANASVTVGQTATFSVTASSSPAISQYQWQRSTDSGGSWANLTDGGPYSGTASATLTVASTTVTMNNDQFRIVLTNSVGTSTSNPAVLTVSQAPVFTSAASTTFVVNQSNSFTVTATGFPAPTLGYNVSGFPSWAQFNPATGVIFGSPSDTSNSPFTFTLTATSGSQVTTQQFTLTVSPTSLVPLVTTQPTDQSVGLTQNATFTAVVTGNPTPTYQWQRYRSGDSAYSNLTDGGQYSGTTTATLTITGVTAEMSGDQYRLVATNSLGSATSNSATLTITVGSVFSTVAGTPGVKGTSDGKGSAAQFNAPTALVVNAGGTMFVADAANHAIRKIASDGTVTTFAGLAGTAGTADGLPGDARFNTPSAIAMDASGNFYVADSANHTIRSVSSTGYVQTVAGSAGALGNADGTGSNARFAYPSGIAVDNAGTIYVADTLNNKIRRITQGGGTYSVQTMTLTDTSGNPVTLSLPNSIAVDSSSNLYVADTRNHVVRKITPSGVTTTLAGTVGAAGTIDGNGSAARFNQPEGIAVDASGNVYVADTYNDTIRKIATNGDVTTIGGKAGVAGTADGGAGTVRFNQPYGVAVDTSGNIYVADTFNHTIRRSGGVTAAAITTAPQSTTVRATQNATFTVVATGSPTPSYQWQRQAAGTSGFVNLSNDSTYSGVNSATLTVANTTEAMTGDQFQVIVNNLVNSPLTSSAATLTVQPAVTAPSISVQPVTVTVNRGDSPTLSVTASGTTPLSYQWYLNGVALSGATSSTLTLSNAQLANAGLYTVTVSNAGGSVTSSPAGVTVVAPPSISIQPTAQVALAGNPVSFSVTAAPNVTYQWRKNGTAIPGATNSSYVIPSVGASDAANYDVVVANSLGSLTSSLAQLSLTTSPVAPVVTSQPASQTAVLGSAVTFSAAASAAPAASYQWRKNGGAISGATNSTYTLSSVQASDAAAYDVVISNSAGTVTTLSATLQVLAHSYAGVYFGTFSNGLGNFAVYVRPDNTGVFLGYIQGSTAPIMSLGITVNNAGQFTFTQSATTTSAVPTDTPPIAAALASTTVNGVLGTDGSVSGALSGGASATLNGTRSPDTGTAQGVAGFYLAGSSAGAGNLLTIVGANGQAYAIEQIGTTTDGGSGTATSSGIVTIATSRSTITEGINASNGTVSATSSGTLSGSFNGAVERAVNAQRLANISTRARVSGGDSVAIAGFVISGTDSKPVLIRAVGPTLVNFGVSGALASPKLDLYRGTALIATNTGVSTATNAAAIAAAGSQIGAFALGSAGTDSAMLVTLPPGAYTAQVSGVNNTSGIALVEVYDMSGAAAGQKLVNISTRAAVGTGDNALIAGVVVNGTAPKRVLIRAVGPGLSAFGVSGVLATPVLTLKTQAGATIATNTGWSTSADSAAITSGNVQAGAFALSTGDSAMIVTLPPGGYSAQVTGVNGATGVALVEIYELQ